MSAPRWDVEGRDWPHRDTSRFVEVGGLRWHVQVAGSGPVVLLIHGTAAATHSWRDLMPLLAEHFTVVVPDLPGHAFTGAMRRPGLPEVARGLTALCAALEVEPALIIGHSAGAAIAVTLAANGLMHPKAIIGIGGALLPFEDVAGRLFPQMARWLFAGSLAPELFALATRQPGMIASFLPRTTGSRIDAAGMALYARLMARSGHVGGALALMAHWDLEPVGEALASLDLPVLLIHGDRDATIPPATSRTAAKRLPNGRVAAMPGLGHLAHEEQPEATARLILDFAAETGILTPVEA